MSKASPRKSTSRTRRRTAREKAHAGYDAAAHPRTHLADVVDLESLSLLLAPVVAASGLVLEEVTARGAGNTQTLTVVVDLPEDAQGTVSLDRIAELSPEVSAALDKAAEGPESAYQLEITSPGATRRLTEPRHWKRSRGHLVEITTTEQEKFLARLEEVAESTVRIRRRKETPKGVPEAWLDPEDFPLASVRRARVEVEFDH